MHGSDTAATQSVPVSTWLANGLTKIVPVCASFNTVLHGASTVVQGDNVIEPAWNGSR